MRRLVLVPNNMGSRGAKALADTLSTKLNYKVFRVRPERVKKRIPFVLRQGTDKLTQLRKFHEAGVSAPEYCTDRSVALNWLRDGCVVVCRTLLRSSEGRGIVIAENEDQLVDAPLYTKYIKKKKEFRVHVLNGEVIDVQEKRKRKDFQDERDTRIRNSRNGYVFCHDAISEPDSLRSISISAVQAIGYSLGAVDVAYNAHSDRCFVLEVNATPGMEGSTLESYSNAILNWYGNQN